MDFCGLSDTKAKTRAKRVCLFFACSDWLSRQFNQWERSLSPAWSAQTGYIFTVSPQLFPLLSSFSAVKRGLHSFRFSPLSFVIRTINMAKVPHKVGKCTIECTLWKEKVLVNVMGLINKSLSCLHVAIQKYPVNIYKNCTYAPYHSWHLPGWLGA